MTLRVLTDKGENRIISGREGMLLRDALLEAGVRIDSPCGGHGTCGKCRVKITGGQIPVSRADRSALSEEELAEGRRLACTAVIPEGFGELEVLVSEESENLLTPGTLASVPESTEGECCPGGGVGIAIDLGTTTLAFALADLATGAVLATSSRANSQRQFGADVISRIEAACGGKAEKLRQAVVRDISEEIDRLLSDSRVDRQLLKKICIAGNTTMEHLLMGYSCETLGVFPFQAVTLETGIFSAGKVLDREDLEETEVILLPGISVYVGADILAGMMVCGFDRGEGSQLLIDLGTNGEMALRAGQRILVTSAAAGPAFEGGGISCGTAGIPGAICSADVKEDQSISFGTIGGISPVGICGTGLVETADALRRIGALDETGLLSEEYFDTGYPLGDGLVLTQKDIRGLQLAKGAVRAGCEVLLAEMGINAGDPEILQVAGGFGYALDLTKAAGIGLFDSALVPRAEAVGNTSLAGALKVLTEESAFLRMEEIKKRAEEIHLSSAPGFEKLFYDHMALSDH